jgi:hypothetical protein
VPPLKGKVKEREKHISNKKNISKTTDAGYNNMRGLTETFNKRLIEGSSYEFVGCSSNLQYV